MSQPILLADPLNCQSSLVLEHTVEIVIEAWTWCFPLPAVLAARASFVTLQMSVSG